MPCYYALESRCCKRAITEETRWNCVIKRAKLPKIADNLTLKEITEMGYTVDLCDEAYDANEHWKAEGKTEGMGEYPEE